MVRRVFVNSLMVLGTRERFLYEVLFNVKNYNIHIKTTVVIFFCLF